MRLRKTKTVFDDVIPHWPIVCSKIKTTVIKNDWCTCYTYSVIIIKWLQWSCPAVQIPLGLSNQNTPTTTHRSHAPLTSQFETVCRYNNNLCSLCNSVNCLTFYFSLFFFIYFLWSFKVYYCLHFQLEKCFKKRMQPRCNSIIQCIPSSSVTLILSQFFSGRTLF